MQRAALVAVVGAACVLCQRGADRIRFQHHTIASGPVTVASSPGYGAPVLADFDKDGDPDFAVLERGGKLVWFENAGKDPWKPHEAGELPVGQLGSLDFDVDGDGWIDIVVGGFWFRNPGKPRELPFQRFAYDASIKTEIHDITAADMDGDGQRDIVVLGDREGVYWYRIPAQPMANADWPRTVITRDVLNDADDIHGGIAPRGVADLDGDGDADVALTDRWLENRGRGQQWVKHPLPFGTRGPWGLSSRSWIADLDRDGDADIVIADCDQAGSRAGWLENNGQRPPKFRLHVLPDSAAGRRGSFHSLIVADFDADGDLDIVTAEQEDPKILPEGAPPRFFLWENQGGKPLRFVQHVILDARLGGHDIQAGDVDGDGDLDIVSKVWRAWTGSANAGKPHVDWLENLTRRR
ncbi:MAG: VCBS repeat-containing protein [Acidobacteria bacterium]|nr:VCBS repeat-containing protein [Acidobacteriota bacterium]